MKLGLTKEWHKYWFVLQDVALLYYRDPAAESMVRHHSLLALSALALNCKYVGKKIPN